MTEFFLSNISFIIILPLIIFALIVFNSVMNIAQSQKLSLSLTLIASGIGILFSAFALVNCIHNPYYVLESSINWMSFESIGVNFKFGTLIDNLSALMIFVVTTVSFIVQLFAHSYMKDDSGYNRFYAYLNLFSFSMLGLVLSSNLIQTYIFWELVGVSSYLLIGFWFSKRSASKAAKKAFIVNRIGDVGLLFGIIALIYFVFNFDISQDLPILSFVNISFWANSIYGLTNNAIFYTVCTLLFMGSIAKSAQFPLHVWLEDAMEGPTPVSALIHAATMVAAGVYLVGRLYPLYSLSTPMLHTILTVGLITTFLAALVAISQNDIKKVLAYSTCSQLGLMYVALGVGAFAGGIFHLVTHAYFKALLFLSAGLIIHCLSNKQDMRFMGGLKKYFPTCRITYLIACIAISGIFFSGFFSKEMIYSFIYENSGTALFFAMLCLSSLTAFYMFRTYFMIFEGKYRGDCEPHKADIFLNLPLILLAAFTVIVGLFFVPEINKLLIDDFDNITNTLQNVQSSHFVLIMSIIASLVGFLVALVMHKIGRFTASTPKNDVLYNVSYNKFYINEIYRILIDKIIFGICKFFDIIDKYVINGIVNFCVAVTRFTSVVISELQNGNIQTYISYSLFVKGAFLFILVWVYYWIMKV